MKLPLITRSRHERELDAAQQATRRAEKELVAEKLRHALEIGGAEAANTRLAGRNRELSRRLDSAHDKELGELGDIAQLEERARLAEVHVRQLEKDVARLQARLDDAVGTPAGKPIRHSGPWQPGYKPKADA
ncbi:hypothetical protein [Streptomyces tauricus]|uniref:hypothetical protein n=1 Tax=Streptomyces tauricus TaxID=68274 RepID=UPI00342D253A